MDYRKSLSLTSAAVLAATAFAAGDDHDHGVFDPWTGEGFEIATADDSIRFTPYVYASAVFGESSADHPGDLFVGEHDPDETGLDLQSIEFSGRLDLGDYFNTRIAVRGFLDDEDQLDAEIEELVATINDSVGDSGLRFGRYLNRFGIINQTHAHDWAFVDTPLAVGRILGPHGLRTEGGELNIGFGPRLSRSLLSVSFGQVVEHDHDHEDHEGDHHAHEDEHDHDHEDDHDHDHEDGHDHAGEAFAFDDTFMTLRLRTQWIVNDFHRWTPSASLAFGSNESGANTHILGLGLAYNWFENGYQPGGARVSFDSEFFVRNLRSGSAHGEEDHDHGQEHDHDSEHDHDHDSDHDHDHDHDGDHHHNGEEHDSVNDHEFGFYTQALYAPNPHFEAGGRLEYVSGSDEAELEERWRLSPVATLFLNEARSASLRAQYNYDILEDTEEHGIWIQLSLSWGGHAH